MNKVMDCVKDLDCAYQNGATSEEIELRLKNMQSELTRQSIRDYAEEKGFGHWHFGGEE